MKKIIIPLAKFFASVLAGLIFLTGILAIWYQTGDREVKNMEPL